MRIALDLTSLADNLSGIERFASNIAQGMIRKSGHQYILIFKNAVHEDFKALLNERVEAVVLTGNRKLAFNQLVLLRGLGRIKADWYVFLAFPPPLLFWKRHTVVAIHDICCWDCPETMKPLSKHYFRISHRKARLARHYVVTISQFSKQRIADRLRVPEDRLWVILCAPSAVFTETRPAPERLEEIRAQYKLPDRYILSLGTLEPRKNLRFLLEAYSELVEERRMDVGLVLVGRNGWKVDNLLAGLPDKAREKIVMTGFVPDEALPPLYSRADLFAFPSIYEGFGIPPLEAMSVGTPVVSSDATSLPEVLGDAAFYFKSNDKESLKRTLRTALSTSAESARAARAKCLEQSARYSWDAEALKLISHLEKELQAR